MHFSWSTECLTNIYSGSKVAEAGQEYHVYTHDPDEHNTSALD